MAAARACLGGGGERLGRRGRLRLRGAARGLLTVLTKGAWSQVSTTVVRAGGREPESKRSHAVRGIAVWP